MLDTYAITQKDFISQQLHLSISRYFKSKVNLEGVKLSYQIGYKDVMCSAIVRLSNNSGQSKSMIQLLHLAKIE